MPRRDTAPRKVLLATAITGYEIFAQSLEQRLDRMDELVATMADQARTQYPGKRLDLVVLPENFLASLGRTMPEQAARLGEVRGRIAECARRHDCYLVVPMWLREEEEPARYSNAAVLVGRDGEVVGIYRKVHPVASLGSDVLEGGTTPGRGFPVFDCDFGRVGILICWDMVYDDGWEALARQGAGIVALPSASPNLNRAAMYALRHRYYVVSAAPRDNAAVLNPIGMPEARISEPSVLVHQIDLAYAILHWSETLEEGLALGRKFGDRIGFHYYRSEDTGIFWSNDPATTIGQMIGSLGLAEADDEIERVRLLQDKARGGPPAMPPCP